MNANIKKFLDEVNANDQHAAAYAQSKDLKEVSELAHSMGYSFSPAELQDYFQKSQSLSDSDLDNISGGTSMMGSTSSAGSHGGWYSGD